MALKPKKTKIQKATSRGVRHTKNFADKTQARVATALDGVANDTYNTADLVNDIMGQWFDFVDTMNKFAGNDDDDVSTAHLIVTGTAPIPTPEPVSLTDSVPYGLIDKTDLAGPATFPAANYDVLDESGVIPAAGTELDRVRIRLNSKPGTAGIYQGFLTLQANKVLARIIVIRK